MRFFPLLPVLLWVALTVCGGAAPVSPVTSADALAALSRWLESPADSRPPLLKEDFATVALMKGDARRAAELLWQDHAEQIRKSREKEMAAKVIELDGLRMPFETVYFPSLDASVPADGRSLFLSLHGGGGTTTAVNDSQWKNQVRLAQAYRPKEGIYLAPRAPTDTWDLWHQPHIDRFLQRLIENLVVLENVNPNRVYILGYSAGGDGIYQLGPRLADRWAAASMMAGHPNDASPLGLRNIGFSIQVGAKDGAYRRNAVAAEWDQKLAELQKADPNGYAHFVEVHEGKGHWMELKDAKAVAWMETFTRNPLPDKIVWHQDDVLRETFYWLAVPKDEARAGVTITAQRQGQTIALESKDARGITVRLTDAMLDLDQQVIISRDGKEVFRGRVERTVANLWSTLSERGDPNFVFSAEVQVPPEG